MTSGDPSLLETARTLRNSGYLLAQLVRRDVALRYRGALFGVLWAVLNPLIMLAIFAFVFGSILQTRWPDQPDGLPFWIILYSGLIVFNVFAEAVSRSPGSVRDYPSFVKKIIFPLVILPVVPLGAALAHGAFSLLILGGALAWTGHLAWGIVLVPLLIVPAVLLALGLSWFLAVWGVYIRDIAQIVPVFVQMLLFMSPVLYPASAVPAALRPIYLYNPLAIVIEASRAAALGLQLPWSAWLVALAIGLATALAGHAYFNCRRQEFADVL